MTTKTHWRKIQDPDYLGSWDFQPGEEKIVKIKSAQVEPVPDYSKKKRKDEPQPTKDVRLIRFFENTKPLICNATNSKAIAAVSGSNYIEDWSGVHIQLFIQHGTWFGEEMDAVRVRKIKPQIKKPELTPTHPKWNEVKGKVQAKEVTFETIRKHYSLSTQNEKLLTV